jgi:hypothetical protein
MVHRLTHECYVTEGYTTPQLNGRIDLYPGFDILDQTKVTVAILGGEVIASHSATIDGPLGIPLDKDFKVECSEMRNSGRKIGAAWRIVTKESLRSYTRPIVMALLRESLAFGMRHGGNTFLTIVNPRHAPVYDRLLNMKQVATSDSTKGMSSAPGVLLRVDYENLPESWRNLTDDPQIHLAA